MQYKLTQVGVMYMYKSIPYTSYSINIYGPLKRRSLISRIGKHCDVGCALNCGA